MEENLKKLLLKDICCRLPYKVKCKYSGDIPMIGEVTNNIGTLSNIHVDKECPFEINGGIYGFADVKPYLRSMSNMTEEEEKEMLKAFNVYYCYYDRINNEINIDCDSFEPNQLGNLLDWLNERHFDYRGLIEKNLALEAPKGVYDLNN